MEGATISSQSSTPPTSNHDASIVIVNTHDSLETLISCFERLPNEPPAFVFLDAKGTSHNRLAELHFLFRPVNALYIVQTAHIEDSSLFLNNVNKSLGRVLESTSISKVGFDLRDIARALFSQYNINLRGVLDIQLMELASRADKTYLAGFDKCVCQDLPSSEPNSFPRSPKSQADGDSGSVATNGNHCSTTLRRVEMFPALWTIYRGRLSSPGEAFWLRSARFESDTRIQDAIKDNRSQQPRNLGPFRWWDPESLLESIWDWNEEVLMEQRIGQWRLNENAEWIDRDGNRC